MEGDANRSRFELHRRLSGYVLGAYWGLQKKQRE